MKLSIREQLQDWVFINHHDWCIPKPKGGYKEPLIFLNVSKDVLDKCRCTKYGHPRVARKPRDLRPDALRTPVLEPIVPADSPIPHYVDNEYGVAFNAVV